MKTRPNGEIFLYDIESNTFGAFTAEGRPKTMFKPKKRNYILGNKKLKMSKQDQKGYPCPCCGFLTLSENTHETFEICPVCNWEDDDIQFANPDFEGGAKEESLNEARNNYKQFGASAKKYIKNVRSPLPDEIP